MMRSNRISLQLALGLVVVAGCSSSPAPTAAAPVITAQPASITVVSGAPATFSVAATASNGALSYQWRKDGLSLSNGVNASLALAAVTADDFGVYDCIVTNTLDGLTQVAVSSGAILAVNANPAIIAQPVPQTAAPGGTVVFMVAASGNGTISYQWQKNGVDIAGATGPSYTIDSADAA